MSQRCLPSPCPLRGETMLCSPPKYQDRFSHTDAGPSLETLLHIYVR